MWRITFVGRGQWPLAFLAWFKMYPETVRDTIAISRSFVEGSAEVDGPEERMYSDGRHITFIRDEGLTLRDFDEILRYGWSYHSQEKVK